jgi:membrane-bound lytic murein transglycosylase D
MILGATQSQILLPFDNAQQFETNFKVVFGPARVVDDLHGQRAHDARSARAENRRRRRHADVETNRIPRGMRLKPGSTVVVPRSDDDDEDISADVAESAVLAMEPDVPDTRKVLIRDSPRAIHVDLRRSLQRVDLAG